MRKGLSKSKIILGLQCEKALYLSVHRPDLMPPVAPGQQAVFDQGHEVGLEAHKHFDDVVVIDVPRYEMARAAELTQQAIASGARTIAEATFIHDGVVVRVDILHRPAAKKPWRLYEIKSTTSVKEEHLTDVAIQSWVLDGAGIRHDRATLMHLNSECVFPKLEKLFTQEDITAQVMPLKKEVPKHVERLQKALSGKVPSNDIGPHCDSPYECAYKAHCFKEKKIPKVSILDLKGSSETRWELYAQGIRKLDDPRIDLEELRGVQPRDSAIPEDTALPGCAVPVQL